MSFHTIVNKPEFAEFYGILMGDGHVCGINNQITITGHPINDYEYYLNYLLPLIKTLFKKDVQIHNYGNFIRIFMNGKDICQLLAHLKFPRGRKGKFLVIPRCFSKDKKLLISLIRGLFDTDGSLYFETTSKYKSYTYPRLRIKIVNCPAIDDINSFLISIGFSTYRDLERQEGRSLRGRIRISGRSMLEKWVKTINFHNPYHSIKYKIWKKFGFCPPNLNIVQLKQFYVRGRSITW